MKKSILTLVSGVFLTASVFSIQPAFSSSGSYEKEFCAVSQAEKCKQSGKTCPGKKVCFWKDLGEIAGTAGKVAGAVVAGITIAEALD